MQKHIRVTREKGVWSVRAGGAVIAESENALELNEGDYDPVIYFPQEDVAMALLEKTDQKTKCAHKGEAVYFSIVTKSQVIENAAWTYEAPRPELKNIANHMAFYRDELVVIEEI